MSFYHFVTTPAKDSSKIVIADRGEVRHTAQGDLYVLRSLADAQRLARVFREAGLLT